MDLRPPTIVRLERTLAHWSSMCSSDLVFRSRRYENWLDVAARRSAGLGSRGRRRRRGQPVNGKGDTRTGQTGPSRRRPTGGPPRGSAGFAPERGLFNLPVVGSTIVEHCGFPNASPSGDLGCGKSTSAELPTLSRRWPREGKNRGSDGRGAFAGRRGAVGIHGAPHAHHVDCSVDNEHDH